MALVCPLEWVPSLLSKIMLIIRDETHLELKLHMRLEIDYEIHSHSVHKVRKLYMRYVQE